MGRGKFLNEREELGWVEFICDDDDCLLTIMWKSGYKLELLGLELKLKWKLESIGGSTNINEASCPYLYLYLSHGVLFRVSHIRRTASTMMMSSPAAA